MTRRVNDNDIFQIACMLFAAFAVGTLLIVQTVASEREHIPVAACLILNLFMCLIGPMISVVELGRFELADPLNYISAAFLLYFVIGPAYCVVTGEFSLPLTPRPALLVSALLLAALALAACLAGYFSPIGKLIGGSTTGRFFREDRRRGLRYAIGLEMVGGIMFSLWLWTAGLSFSAVNALAVENDYGGKARLAENAPNSYLHLGEALFIPAALLMWYFRPRNGWRHLVSVNLLVILWFFVITGARWRLLLYVFAMLLLMRLTSTVKIGLGRLTIVALLFCASMPVLGYYRSVTGTLKVSGMDRALFIRSTLSSISIFDTFVVIIENIPDNIGYLHGGVLWDLLVSPYHGLFGQRSHTPRN
jgi:hypothetical protein